jgi:hypothetical protein
MRGKLLEIPILAPRVTIKCAIRLVITGALKPRGAPPPERSLVQIFTSTPSGATEGVVNNVLALEIGGAGQIMMPNLPTSSSGLKAGSLWNNRGAISIVP